MKFKKQYRDQRGLIQKSAIFLVASFVLLFFVSGMHASAKDLTSTNFIIRDPVIGTGGGYGTSTNFKLISEGDTILTGVGSSATFIGHYGFLYYPFVVAPVLTATPNGADAILSWTAAQAAQGWSVGGYKTGISAVPGGPYTYTDVGNVTGHVYTTLTPGNYCFIVQVYDSLGYTIATSNEECITITISITFDLDTATTDTESGASYTVPLGVLTTGSITRSNGSVNSIWTDLESNGSGGTVVTIISSKAALKSVSVPTDTIPSATATMAAGTTNYGLCVASATAGTGTYVAASPFNGATCVDGAVNTVGGLTGSTQNILTTSGGAITGGRAQIRVNAGISGTTPAHVDYSDILTFIATSTF